MAIEKPTEIPWRELLAAAVSPLESGVQSLRVAGYRPPGIDSYRPGRNAAVLVPLLDLDEPQIVFTRRADHLTQHAGQVSFPGGGAEDHDNSAVETALREAYEEIGLPPERTRPIGFLDRLDTISDYRVLPVVALVRCPVIWKLDYREVAEVFTVPLSFALDRNQYSRRHVTRDGQVHVTWQLQWEKHVIWGATSAMLLNLAKRMERVLEY